MCGYLVSRQQAQQHDSRPVGLQYTSAESEQMQCHNSTGVSHFHITTVCGTTASPVLQLPDRLDYVVLPHHRHENVLRYTA